MPALTYKLIPQYGLEPYADNGGLGGALLTGDNLVVTVWEATTGTIQAPPAPPITFGNILKPNSVNTSVGVSAAERAASLQAKDSRNSAHFSFHPTPQAGPAAFCMVVNPPEEYKQMMAGALVYNGGDPYDVASYTVKKSLQGNFFWRAIADAHPVAVPNEVDLFSYDLIFGAYPPNVGPAGNAKAVQLLKTSGADGVTPQFFNLSSPSGVQDMIDTIDDGGQYYIPVLNTNAVSSTLYAGVVYPHSAARG